MSFERVLLLLHDFPMLHHMLDMKSPLSASSWGLSSTCFCDFALFVLLLVISWQSKGSGQVSCSRQAKKRLRSRFRRAAVFIGCGLCGCLIILNRLEKEGAAYYTLLAIASSQSPVLKVVMSRRPRRFGTDSTTLVLHVQDCWDSSKIGLRRFCRFIYPLFVLLWAVRRCMPIMFVLDPMIRTTLDDLSVDSINNNSIG